MKRDITIARTNYRYLYYFSFYNRELIIIICRKSVLIDTFILDKVIRIVTKMVISP
jgi:hypothetical protein